MSEISSNSTASRALADFLVLGAAYQKISDTTCSATTIRRRRDEWIDAGIFPTLEQICLEAYDRVEGLDLENLCVDGCIVKAPCGGEIAGKSPVDRSKLGTKRYVITDGNGIPIGCVAAPANRNDSPLSGPTLEKLSQFGFHLPDHITVHLDAGYGSTKTRNLLAEFGCDWEISTNGEPLQACSRWVVERTNAWHTRGFKKPLICTERRTRVNNAFIALANAVIIIRNLIRKASPPTAGTQTRNKTMPYRRELSWKVLCDESSDSSTSRGRDSLLDPGEACRVWTKEDGVRYRSMARTNRVRVQCAGGKKE